MSKLRVQVASYVAETVAGNDRVRGQLEQAGARWFTSSVFRRLWDASAPGDQIATVKDFPPSPGVFIDAESGCLALYLVERRIDRWGRRGQSRWYWVVNASDAQALRYNFGPLRRLLGESRGDEQLARISSLDIDVTSDAKRLDNILSRHSDSDWVGAWLGIVDSVMRGELPEALGNLTLSTEDLLELAEAVSVSLPLPWRKRFSFSIGIAPPKNSPPVLKFVPASAPSLAQILPDHRILEWPCRWNPGKPEQDYTRLLADAFRQRWLAELFESVEAEEKNERDEASAFVERVYARVAKRHYRTEELRQLDDKIANARSLSLLLASLSDAKAVRQEMSPDDRAELDRKVLDRAVALIRVAQADDPCPPPADVFAAFPWSSAQLVQLARELLLSPLSGSSRKDQQDVVAALRDKLPAGPKELLRQSWDDPVLEALLVAFAAWDSKLAASRTHSYKTERGEWVIKTGNGAVPATPRLATEPDIAGLVRWAYVLRFKNGGWLGVRPAVAGSSLDKDRVRDLEDRRKQLVGVAETLSAIHGAGFAHGDIREENVLISTDRAVLLAADPDKSDATQTLIQRQARDRADFAEMLYRVFVSHGVRAPREEIEAFYTGKDLVDTVNRTANLVMFGRARADLPQIWPGDPSLLSRGYDANLREEVRRTLAESEQKAQTQVALLRELMASLQGQVGKSATQAQLADIAKQFSSVSQQLTQSIMALGGVASALATLLITEQAKVDALKGQVSELTGRVAALEPSSGTRAAPEGAIDAQPGEKKAGVPAAPVRSSTIPASTFPPEPSAEDSAKGPVRTTGSPESTGVEEAPVFPQQPYVSSQLEQLRPAPRSPVWSQTLLRFTHPLRDLASRLIRVPVVGYGAPALLIALLIWGANEWGLLNLGWLPLVMLIVGALLLYSALVLTLQALRAPALKKQAGPMRINWPAAGVLAVVGVLLGWAALSGYAPIPQSGTPTPAQVLVPPTETRVRSTLAPTAPASATAGAVLPPVTTQAVSVTPAAGPSATASNTPQPPPPTNTPSGPPTPVSGAEIIPQPNVIRFYTTAQGAVNRLSTQAIGIIADPNSGARWQFRVLGRNAEGTAFKIDVPTRTDLSPGWVPSDYIKLPDGLPATSLPVLAE